MVDVLVGPAKMAFRAQRALLCERSKFFRAALMGSFREGKEQKVELPEATPAAFRRFLLWCYAGRVIDGDEDMTESTGDRLVELYQFAGFLGLHELQNAAIDGIIEIQDITKRLSPGDIYDSTEEGSPLRRLVVDVAVRDVDWNDIDEDLREDHLPWEYLFDLVIAFGQQSQQKTPRRRRDFWNFRCDYHIHPAGEAHCAGLKSRARLIIKMKARAN